jgi:hypothetical protein
MQRIRPGTLLLIGLCCTAPVSEAQAPEALRACLTEKSDALRLSCYDREMARLEHHEDVAPSPVAATGPATETAEERFGFRGTVAREATDREKAAAGELEQLQGKIVGISSRPRGERVVTLSNNQVWVQKSADVKIRLKVGDEVTIKSGALGSFLLFSSGQATRVTRVQ